VTAVYVVGGVVVVVAIAVVFSYNRFVTQRQLVANSWSNVDTELRRRYDLVPNLVETVKGYASHERETLEAVTQARTQAVTSTGTPAEQARDENVLVGALKSVLAVAERYPELRASDHFLDLQRELVTTENRIQAARRFYNANVRDYNQRVESVPSNIVAALSGFRREDYFEVEPVVRETPGVAFDTREA
jgi:LemA protein